MPVSAIHPPVRPRTGRARILVIVGVLLWLIPLVQLRSTVAQHVSPTLTVPPVDLRAAEWQAIQGQILTDT